MEPNFIVYIIVLILATCFVGVTATLLIIKKPRHYCEDVFKLYKFGTTLLISVLFVWCCIATFLCFIPGDVVLTNTVVAHTSTAEPDYKVVYVDKKADISYVVITNRNASAVGDEVLLSNGAVDEIVELLPDGFRIANKDSTVAAGMSGTPVLQDGKTIGLISSYYADGSVYCIWY